MKERRHSERFLFRGRSYFCSVCSCKKPEDCIREACWFCTYEVGP